MWKSSLKIQSYSSITLLCGVLRHPLKPLNLSSFMQTPFHRTSPHHQWVRTKYFSPSCCSFIIITLILFVLLHPFTTGSCIDSGSGSLDSDLGSNWLWLMGSTLLHYYTRERWADLSLRFRLYLRTNRNEASIDFYQHLASASTVSITSETIKRRVCLINYVERNGVHLWWNPLVLTISRLS